MEKNYQFLDIEINKPIYRKLSAIQYDNNSRYILVSVYSNFKPYDLTHASVKIYGIKKDKTVFFNNAKILDAENGKFEIDLTEQCLAVDGDVEIQIIILGANQERLSSNSFILNVKKSIIDPVKVTSQDQWGILTEGLKNLAEYDIYKQNIKENTDKIMTLKSKLDTVINVKDFGALGDKRTDDSTSFQNAIDYCTKNKKTLFVPSGEYIIDNAFSLEALSNLTMIGEGNNTKLYYSDKKNPIWIGSNTHISDLCIIGHELIEDVLIVAGYFKDKFVFSHDSSIENVNITSTYWSTWTAIRMLGRNGGFYNFKLINLNIGSDDFGGYGMGKCIDVLTYQKFGEDAGWLTDIVVDNVFFRGFLDYALNVLNDYDKNDRSEPGQLTQSSFTNLRIQAQSRGGNCKGVLIGGGGNVYQITNIFNDTMSDDFSCLYFYNHLKDCKTLNNYKDFVVGGNTITFGMVEGKIEFNNSENLNNYSGYSVNYGYLKSDKKNILPNGNFEKDVIGYPLVIEANYGYNPHQQCIALDGNSVLGKKIIYCLSNYDMQAINNSKVGTMWILASTDNGSDLNDSTFRKEFISSEKGFVSKVINRNIKIGNKTLFILNFEFNINVNIDITQDGKYAFLQLFFDYAVNGDMVNIYEFGFSPTQLIYENNISCADLPGTKKIALQSRETKKINYKTLFGYHYDVYNTVKINSFSNITTLKNKDSVTITNNTDEKADIYITY